MLVLCIPCHSAIVCHNSSRQVPWKFDFFRNPHKYVIVIWWHQVLDIRHTMADITIATLTPKDPMQRFRSLKGIDPDDPNDVAINLVTMFVLLWLTLNREGPRTWLHWLLCGGSNGVFNQQGFSPSIKCHFIITWSYHRSITNSLNHLISPSRTISAETCPDL